MHAGKRLLAVASLLIAAARTLDWPDILPRWESDIACSFMFADY